SKAPEEAHDGGEARGGDSAEPERGPPTMTGQPLAMALAHLLHLQRRVVGHAAGRDRRRLARSRRLITWIGAVGTVPQHRAGRLGEEIEGGPPHPVLKVGIVRAPERVTEREWNEERARRLHLLRVLAHHADGRRRDSARFEPPGEHPTGVRAGGP